MNKENALLVCTVNTKSFLFATKKITSLLPKTAVLANSCLVSEALIATELPEVKDSSSFVFINKHVFPIAHTKPVQHTLNGLQPAGDPGPTRSVKEPLVHG